jgi:hypothetical protein
MLLGRLVESGGRAMPTGGEIVVTTGWLHLVSGGLPPSGFGAIRHVRLTVGDTGRQDDEALWKRVLEPEKGAHIVHADDCIAAIVQRLGGWLLVENAEGEGCRIHVCLPTMMTGGA